jgi:hypothetical protein
VTNKRDSQTVFFTIKLDPFRLLKIFFNTNKICQIVTVVSIITSFILITGFNPAICQYSFSTTPISYFYTNPLFFSDYGYINSIIEPFYYLGYGYKTPINGNTLLAWNRYTPFNDAYSAYLLNFIGIPTYTYFASPYQTTFPYQTLPGTDYPYARFDYPTYSYGSVNNYQFWSLLQ